MKIAIDADSLLYAANWKMEKDDKDITWAVDWFHKRIKHIMEAFEEEYSKEVKTVKIVFSSDSNFRKEIDPEYKANRPERPLAINKIKQRVMEDNPMMIRIVEGFEADDVVKWLNTYFDYDVASPDKDVKSQMQVCFDYQKNYFTDILTDEEIEFNIWKQCIVGDRSDNIKGINGIGPKGAEIFLSDFGLDFEAICTISENYQSFVDTMNLIRLDQMDANGNLELWIPEESKYVGA